MSYSGKRRAARPRALVTGCAGFLGSHLSERLLLGGWSVTGVDCFSGYYSRAQKEANLVGLRDEPEFSFRAADLACDPLEDLLDGVDSVFHLAAQPGVRASFGAGLKTYLRHNVTATQRLLDAAASSPLSAFVYASSSSVYGDQEVYPVSEDAALLPISPYGATKVITEQLAAAYWRGHGVPTVGLRYFTVYGPRQRPDMAFSRFLTRALADQPLPILGDGCQVREFTYVDDVIEATVAAAARGRQGAVYNIGGGQAVSVLDVVRELEGLLGRRLQLDHRPALQGDPRRTEADTSRAQRELDFRPSTGLAEGLAVQLETMLDARQREPAAA